LFAHERKTIRTMNESAKNTKSMKVAFFEAGIDFTQSMDKFNSIVESALESSNYVYNEHVQESMNAYSVECLNKSAAIIETSIDILVAFKNIIVGEMQYLKGMNRKVIELYEPLLKRLDRHKYGYQIPEYTLENLEPDEILTRVLDLLGKKYNLNVLGRDAISFDQVDNAIVKYTKNADEYYDELKRVVLGVPNSANISNFFSIVRELLVKDNNLQMKRIGDGLFTDFRVAALNLESIDRVINLLQKESSDILSYKSQIEHVVGDEYTHSVYTNAIVIRTNMIGAALSYIEDIIKYKITIFEEMCINYRKVIIDGYNKISKDPESIEGIYTPDTDTGIVEEYKDHLSKHSVIISE